MKGERIINLGNPLYSSDAINTSYLHSLCQLTLIPMVEQWRPN